MKQPGRRRFAPTAVLQETVVFSQKIEYDGRRDILQTARIYSRTTDKSTLLAVRSRDSLQVLLVCSINGCRGKRQ